LYYEEQSHDSTRDALKSLKPLIGSKIIYYKNGECLNESAVDLYDGKYFPTVSLYKNCTLSVNFGPNFKYPPPQTNDLKYKGVCIQLLIRLSYSNPYKNNKTFI
jgi:Set1/Ash2 histone methyltransferase complex subunit ASH2